MEEATKKEEVKRKRRKEKKKEREKDRRNRSPSFCAASIRSLYFAAKKYQLARIIIHSCSFFFLKYRL